MTLAFDREVIILAGVPVIGTVTVELHAEKGDDGLWELDLEPIAFEPETPVPGLLWPTIEAPCEDWLAANEARVQKRFDRLNHP